MYLNHSCGQRFAAFRSRNIGWKEAPRLTWIIFPHISQLYKPIALLVQLSLHLLEDSYQTFLCGLQARMDDAFDQI